LLYDSTEDLNDAIKKENNLKEAKQEKELEEKASQKD
jgi:hypothetical protein